MPPQAGHYIQPSGQPNTQAPPAPVPGGMPSIDYLNQIAPPQKISHGFTLKQLILLGGGLLVALGVFFAVLIVQSLGPDLTQSSQGLIARTDALEKVTTTSQRSIQTRDLSAFNSSLSIQLSSTSSSLKKAFAEAGIAVDKIDKSITEKENRSELLETLDDARLSGIFDRVYLREMSYEIDMLLVQISDIHERSDSSELKSHLESAYENIKPLHARLIELGSS